MQHICISELVSIALSNGLLPVRCQAITLINAGLLSTGLIGANFSEIWIKILTFSFQKMHLKMASVKWQPFCEERDEFMLVTVRAYPGTDWKHHYQCTIGETPQTHRGQSWSDHAHMYQWKGSSLLCRCGYLFRARLLPEPNPTYCHLDFGNQLCWIFLNTNPDENAFFNCLEYSLHINNYCLHMKWSQAVNRITTHTKHKSNFLIKKCLLGGSLHPKHFDDVWSNLFAQN